MNNVRNLRFPYEKSLQVRYSTYIEWNTFMPAMVMSASQSDGVMLTVNSDKNLRFPYENSFQVRHRTCIEWDTFMPAMVMSASQSKKEQIIREVDICTGSKLLPDMPKATGITATESQCISMWYE